MEYLAAANASVVELQHGATVDACGTPLQGNVRSGESPSGGVRGFPAVWLIDVEMRNAGCLWTLTGHIGYFLQHHTQHLFHPFEEQCRQPSSVSSQTNATLRCEAPSQFPASEVEMVSTS